MISEGIFIVIHELYKQGNSIRAIARLLKMDRKTVKRKLENVINKPIKRAVKTESKLEPYKEYIVEFI